MPVAALALALPAAASPAPSPRAVEVPQDAYRWPAATDAGCALTEPLAVHLSAAGPALSVPAPSGGPLADQLRAHHAAADLARARGCPGGDHLLLIADAALPQLHLGEALRAAGAAGVSATDLLVAPTAASPPAPAPAPAPGPAGAPPLLLRADDQGLHIGLDRAGPPGTGPLPCAAPCAPDDQPWAAAAAALEALPAPSGVVLVLSGPRPVSELVRLAALVPAQVPLLGVALDGGAPAPAAAPPAAAPPRALPDRVPVQPLPLPDLRRGPASALTPTPALTKAQISDTVAQHIPALRACYHRALADAPGLRLHLPVRITIGGDGRVTELQLRAPPPDAPATDPPPPALKACLEAALGAMRFPAPEGGGTVIVTYPFVFVPDDAGGR